MILSVAQAGEALLASPALARAHVRQISCAGAGTQASHCPCESSKLPEHRVAIVPKGVVRRDVAPTVIDEHQRFGSAGSTPNAKSARRTASWPRPISTRPRSASGAAYAMFDWLAVARIDAGPDAAGLDLVETRGGLLVVEAIG